MTQSLEQKLIEAVQGRDYDTVRDCIAQKANLDYLAPQPPHDPALVKKTGPSANGCYYIDDKNDNTPGFKVAGHTPLYVAVANDDLQMTDILLKAGANPNIAIKGGLYPLNIAADTTARDDITALLLEYGANPNVKSPYGERTPLISRAGMGEQFRLVSMMLDKGADPHIQDKYGRTALDKAKERIEESYFKALWEEPLRVAFMTALMPKEIIVDYYQTKRTIALLKRAMAANP